MLGDNVVLRHSPGLDAESILSDGLVIQHSDRLHTLNETAQEIFELCDGSRSIGEIVDELTRRYPDCDDVCKHVRNFISQLHEAGLLTDT